MGSLWSSHCFYWSRVRTSLPHPSTFQSHAPSYHSLSFPLVFFATAPQTGIASCLCSPLFRSLASFLPCCLTHECHFHKALKTLVRVIASAEEFQMYYSLCRNYSMWTQSPALLVHPILSVSGCIPNNMVNEIVLRYHLQHLSPSWFWFPCGTRFCH